MPRVRPDPVDPSARLPAHHEPTLHGAARTVGVALMTLGMLALIAAFGVLIFLATGL